MGKLKIFIAGLCAASAISGCGGGGNSGGFVAGQTGTSNVQSIVISSPQSNAITDNKNGTYKRKFSLLARDSNGTPVADGTRINLKVVDSIIAQGTFNATNTASGTTLTLPGATKADGTAIADLTTTTITRDGVSGGNLRGIQANDVVLLYSNGDSADVLRNVSAAPTAANTLTVSSAYTKSYPTYAAASYRVMASMLGAGIAGVDKNSKATPGYVETLNGEGVGTFYVTYPSNPKYAQSGSYPSVDTRWTPTGSGVPYIIASSGNVAASTTFTFANIAGYTITATPTSWTTSTGTAQRVDICVVDGGDKSRVPFTAVSIVKKSGTATLALAYVAGTPQSGSTYLTNTSGCASVDITLTGAAGTNVLTVGIGDGTLDLTGII